MTSAINVSGIATPTSSRNLAPVIARHSNGPRDGFQCPALKTLARDERREHNTAVFKPLGLDHVVLRVSDQARSQRFYVEMLGCTVDHVNERLSLIHLRFGDHMIDLVPASAGTPTAGGVDHVCLSIDCNDLAGVARELKARGVTVEGEVADRRGAYGRGPSIYIRDPDGYKIELKPR